jgi:hypothetical protein
MPITHAQKYVEMAIKINNLKIWGELEPENVAEDKEERLKAEYEALKQKGLL